jgi:hypothetical protein
VRERHFQRVQGEVDIRAVLIAARGWQPLHHLHSILRHLANRAFLARPVGVGELGDDVATFFKGIEAKGNSKLAAERALHTDLDVVVVNKYSYILSFLHVGVLMPGVGGVFFTTA